MESPYKEIIIFVLGGGLISALIAVSKEIRERVAEKKKQKALDSQSSIDLQRVENESDDALWIRLNDENKRLNAELKELRDSPSLSFTTKTNWYKCYRELGARISGLEMQILKELPHTDLMTGHEELKKKYDELGEKMP